VKKEIYLVKDDKFNLESGPLSNLRVVELGTAVAGPMCGMLLAEMGSDVIKIEIPNRGDDSRYWGRTIKDESPYFIHYNRNKKSVTLNLRTEEGRTILKKIIERCDILIENYRPGVMDKLNLSYDDLRKINNRLIFCSISGFGQTGPYQKLGGYDAIIQAMSGIMSVTGEKEGPPLRVGVPITDILTAIYAAYAISLSLFVRERTGKGERIDVSLFDSAVAAMGQWISTYALLGTLPSRFGNKYPLIAPYEPFPTKDVPIVVATGSQQLWESLCKAISRDDLLSDDRFKTNEDRIQPQNRESLSALLSETFSKKGSEEWIHILRKVGIPSGPINTVDKVLNDPHLNMRGTFVDLDHPVLGKIKMTNVVPKLSNTPGKIKSSSPTLGQHTREVLLELGYSNKEIMHFSQKGII
jgi:CoA:oxalate CoA-transferase